MERRNKGIDAESSVESVECMRVTGAIDKGKVQDDRDLRLAIIDRGGCVEGVSMILVLAMSKGARITPAMPAAETATTSEASGDDEDSTSRPPA